MIVDAGASADLQSHCNYCNCCCALKLLR